jgi:thiol-disulfide isomerase/thioredoxin
MRLTVIVFLTVFAIACGSPNKKNIAQEKTEELSETANDSINTLVEDDVDGGQMLLGRIDKQGLKKDLFSDWFQPNFAETTLDTATIQKLKPLLEGIEIKAFMGTWCEDSQREIPALYAILDATNFTMEKFRLYALDHDKKTPQGFEDDLNIEYVPTLLFYRDGEEIGRFVEYPQVSLEKDILAIVSDADYKHPYAE